MKRWLTYSAVVLSGTALVIYVLWQSIVATLAWYVLVFTLNTDRLASVPGATIPLPQALIIEQAKFDGVGLPLLASSTASLRNGSSTIAINWPEQSAAYYAAKLSPLAEQFANNPALTSEQTAIVCRDIDGANPCQDNQAFIQRVLSASPDEVTLISRRATKIRETVFLSLKDLYTPSDPEWIRHYTNDQLEAYVVFAPKKTLAFVFMENGDEYELSFANVSEPDVITILSGITPPPPTP